MIHILMFILMLIASMETMDYFKEIEKCFFSEKGEEYIGTVSTTKTGLNCKNWKDVLDIGGVFKGTNITDERVAMSQNYCRNPNSNNVGVWCYYGNRDYEFGACDIPKCVEVDNCKHTPMGQEYDGFTNVTKSGISCQPWNKMSPHSHTYNISSMYPDDDIIESSNKCRNPDEGTGPWCYSMNANLRYEYCNVSNCKENLSQAEFFRGQDIQSSINNKILEIDLKKHFTKVTVSFTVQKFFYSNDVQRMTSIRSTKYSSKCQKDLKYYEFCPVKKIGNTPYNIILTFVCNTVSLSIIIITPLDRSQFTVTFKEGPQYVINNALGSDLIQYTDTVNLFYNTQKNHTTKANFDIKPHNISILDNGSTFELIGDNVIPYAVTMYDDVIMTVSKFDRGSIGFFCGECFPERSTISNWFFSSVFEDDRIIQKYINKIYMQKLKTLWMNKDEVNGSVIWNPQETIGKENVKLLVSMIGRGLNIIVGIKAWDYYNSVSKFEDSELTDLFLAAGLWPRIKGLDVKSRFINKAENKLLPLVYLLDYAKTNISSAISVGQMITSSLSNTPYNIFKGSQLINKLKARISELYRTYIDIIPSLVPCIDNPLTNKNDRILLDMFNSILLNSFGNVFTAPGTNLYPGTFNSISKYLENIKIKLSLQFNNENYFFGLFLPVSTDVTVQLKAKKSKKCTLIVNFHQFDVTSLDIWYKWPRTRSDYVIESDTTESITDSFGGLISIICDTSDDSVELRLTNVLRVPMYDLRNGPRDKSWHKLKKLHLPWAILASDTLVFVVPSIAIQNLENPEPIMKLWDEMIKEQFHLRGRNVNVSRREIISADFQVKSSTIQTGYPIGILIQNIINPMLRNKFVFAKETFKNGGHWDVNREVGINLQENIFTFSETGNTTINVFTLAAIQAVSGINSWKVDEGWVYSGGILEFIDHINNGNFSNWQSRPFVGLAIYAQLSSHFGWEFYRQIFRRYDELIAVYNKCFPSLAMIEKIQLWILETSSLVKMNLAPLYDYWHWPISIETEKILAKYPAYLPDDFLTKWTSDKVAEIIKKYGGSKVVTRSPLPIQTIIGSRDKTKAVEGRRVIEEITIS